MHEKCTWKDKLYRNWQHANITNKLPQFIKTKLHFKNARYVRPGYDYLMGKSTNYFRKMPSWNIPKSVQNIPNIYANIWKYIQDVQSSTKTYKMPSGSGAAPHLDILQYIFGMFKNWIFRIHNANISRRTIQYRLMRRPHIFLIAQSALLRVGTLPPAARNKSDFAAVFTCLQKPKHQEINWSASISASHIRKTIWSAYIPAA